MNEELIKQLQKEIKAIERRRVVSLDALLNKSLLKHELSVALGEISEEECSKLDRATQVAHSDYNNKASTREHYISPRYRNAIIIVRRS